MPSKKYKIGVIGLGYVGGAVYYWFNNVFDKPKEIFSYDKYKNIGSIKEINKADIVFICVPTPYYENSGYDDSAVNESLKILTGSKIVVIKSTILPGSTEKFQKLFPEHKILFNPEFLVAKTATQDFLKPNRQIVGYTKKSENSAQMVLDILPPAPLSRIIPATEAEMVKYFGNTFLATKVIFANQIYDICEKLNINYDTVKELAAADPRIGNSHLEIFHDGYRGYSGGCFPKDTKALIDFAKKLGINFTLLEEVNRINDSLIKQASKPLVSVIITTYNRPALLKIAIASVLNQDFKDLELIIIDDFPKDTKVQKIVEDFNDKRIKFIKNESNQGGAVSLNIGLNTANGKYIAILDDDDEWIDEEKLSRQIKFLEENPDYVAVGINVIVVDYATEKEITRSKTPSTDKIIRKNFLLSNPIAHSSLVARREAMLKVGGYDQTLPRGKDYDMLLKLGGVGKLAVLPNYSVKYREKTLQQENILALKAKDAKFTTKVIWRHRKEYPYAYKALLINSCRYLLFTLLRPFYKVIKKFKD